MTHRVPLTAFPASSQAKGAPAALSDLLLQTAPCSSIFRRNLTVQSISSDGKGANRLLITSRAFSLHKFATSPRF
ncbi:hypothetical protein JCGZ_04976 [Jatropha curcas]|uniref:Uncharacterized protein n=1 Tax=Jatropha curcas TaxID=180498 RepID=A0A067L408_JATCU|nr:hypothetical protein JCGZ_04976 [Jatropha curcas]